MVKITIPNIYTTAYTTCTNNYCVQKEVVIPGEAGKQIQLDELTLSLCVAVKGATATGWVTTDVNGVTAVLATWTETEIVYTPKSATPGFTAPEGQDLILKWNLKTSNSTSRAKMKDLTYTYTPKEVAVEDSECLVVIECESIEEADAVAESLSELGATVYTRKAI
jgi:hypothetical protein